jgi:hypothetical protein
MASWSRRRSLRGSPVKLTRDRLFGESAARALKTFSTFGVVVVDLPQQRWEAHQKQFVAAWRTRRIDPVAGTLVRWPQR